MTHCSPAVRREVERILMEKREVHVGVVQPGGLKVPVEAIVGPNELAEYFAEMPPDATIYLGSFQLETMTACGRLQSRYPMRTGL